jgi:hypothetical protein
MVATAYIEGHAIFLRGHPCKRNSKEFFRDGFKAVFGGSMKLPDQITEEAIISDIYDQVRCGLFHHGSTKGKVVLSGNFQKPFSVQVNGKTNHIEAILVNPHLFLAAIESHLSQYVTKLRDPTESSLRDKFAKAWKMTGEAGG